MSLERFPSIRADSENDRRLLEHAHPDGWTNPVPTGRYHLVIVGAGTGGLVSAAIASTLGARVALVERHLMGGDCLNVGCVPSKGVLRAAHAWHDARRAAEDFGGPTVAGTDTDFARAMERMRRLRADIAPVDGAQRFRDMGVDVFLGEGRFVAGDELEVAGTRLRFRKAIIATGGRPAVPPIEGLAEVPFLTNETVFSLVERPDRLGVIGGGPIGCELSQAFARFGAEVDVFDRGEHLLRPEDLDAAHILERALRRDGVQVHLGVSVQHVREAENGLVVTFDRDGKRYERSFDQLLVATGRQPNVESLGLEAAGVDYGAGGIEVDARLRTSNRAIYAIGDVASKLHFTHVAGFQARIAVRNALFFGRGKSGDLVVPWCIYTRPEVAHVGHSAESAAAAGHEVETITLPLDEVDRALLDGEEEGFLRLHLEKGTDRILGGTLVASHAGEMIGYLCLAITQRLGLSKFTQTMFPYPTQADVFRQAGDRFNRRKLTPRISRLLEFWLRLRR